MMIDLQLIQIKVKSELLLLAYLLRQLLAEDRSDNGQMWKKRLGLAPQQLEEYCKGYAKGSASDNLGQGVINKLNPCKSLRNAEQQPNHLLPYLCIAVSDLIETVCNHHDHVRTWHSEAALARKLRTRVYFSLHVHWKAFFSNLSPITQAEASKMKILACERRLVKGTVSRQTAGMRYGRRLIQAQRMEVLGLGHAPISLNGNRHYQQQGAGVMIIIFIKLKGHQALADTHLCMFAQIQCPKHRVTILQRYAPIVPL